MFCHVVSIINAVMAIVSSNRFIVLRYLVLVIRATKVVIIYHLATSNAPFFCKKTPKTPRHLSTCNQLRTKKDRTNTRPVSSVVCPSPSLPRGGGDFRCSHPDGLSPLGEMSRGQRGAAFLVLIHRWIATSTAAIIIATAWRGLATTVVIITAWWSFTAAVVVASVWWGFATIIIAA